MPYTKDPYGEGVALLYPDNRGEKCMRFSEVHYETPIIKGVVNQLRKWPQNILFAFLSACLITGCLAFLVFVTMAICVPTVLGHRMEEISIFKVGASPNVYFFKLDNQKWSTKEFCYIETAARKHPDFNVYLINLMKEEPAKESLTQSNVNRTKTETGLNDSANYDSPRITLEDRLREMLVLANENIKNVNVSVDKFFKGSKLSRVARELNDNVLEIAAKAQLLWCAPGIVLKPNMFCSLDSINGFLCNNKHKCLPDNLATIEPENDIQLTGVPCQAFMGFLVQEISKNSRRVAYTLKDAVQEYCPRPYRCPEIRILDKRKCATDTLDTLDCPVVYSTVLFNHLNIKNFTA